MKTNVQKVYLIHCYGGAYDDAWDENICVVPSEDLAKVMVAKLEAQHATLIPIRKETNKIYEKEMSGFYKNQEKTPPLPRKTKKNEATFEVEMKLWQTAASKILKRNQDKYKELDALAMSAAFTKAIELGVSTDGLQMLGLTAETYAEYLNTFDPDTSFAYEEIDFIN